MNGVQFTNLTTQIGGAYEAGAPRLRALKSRLEILGVAVTYPRENPAAYTDSGLTPYDVALAYYQDIARHDFHVVANEHDGLPGCLDGNMAREMLYAMLQRRPIILLHAPLFQTDVDTFTREIIERQLQRIIICNVTALDMADALYLLRNVASQPVWYMLSNREKRIVTDRVRAYFRHFFERKACAGDCRGGARHGNY